MMISCTVFGTVSDINEKLCIFHPHIMASRKDDAIAISPTQTYKNWIKN